MFKEFLDNALQLHKQGKLSEAATIYSALLNQKPFEQSLQFLLADLLGKKEMDLQLIY